jgi:hypothetical protein
MHARCVYVCDCICVCVTVSVSARVSLALLRGYTFCGKDAMGQYWGQYAYNRTHRVIELVLCLVSEMLTHTYRRSSFSHGHVSSFSLHKMDDQEAALTCKDRMSIDVVVGGRHTLALAAITSTGEVKGGWRWVQALPYIYVHLTRSFRRTPSRARVRRQVVCVFVCARTCLYVCLSVSLSVYLSVTACLCATPRRIHFTVLDQSEVVVAHPEGFHSTSGGRRDNGEIGEGSCNCGGRVRLPDKSVEERDRGGDGEFGEGAGGAGRDLEGGTRAGGRRVHGSAHTGNWAEEGIAGHEDRDAPSGRREGVRENGDVADGVEGVEEAKEETCRFEQVVDGHHCYGMSKGFQALSEPGLVRVGLSICSVSFCACPCRVTSVRACTLCSSASFHVCIHTQPTQAVSHAHTRVPGNDRCQRLSHGVLR